VAPGMGITFDALPRAQASATSKGVAP
jgi:hypothetical protein